MITIALIVIVGLVIVGGFLWGLDEDGLGIAFGAALVAAIIGGLVGFGIIGLLNTCIGDSGYSHEHDQLTALGTQSGFHGEIFLGSGYVDSTQEFAYLTEDDKAGFHLSQGDANISTVYQDSNKDSASVTITYGHKEFWWLSPWDFDGDVASYTFHVPSGSVDNTYNVKAGN